MFILGNFSFLERRVNTVNCCSCWRGTVEYHLPLTQSCFYFESRKLTSSFASCICLFCAFGKSRSPAYLFQIAGAVTEPRCTAHTSGAICLGLRLKTQQNGVDLLANKLLAGRTGQKSEVWHLVQNEFMVCFKSNRKNNFSEACLFSHKKKKNSHLETQTVWDHPNCLTTTGSHGAISLFSCYTGSKVSQWALRDRRPRQKERNSSEKNLFWPLHCELPKTSRCAILTPSHSTL